jgi:hypothetical protein
MRNSLITGLDVLNDSHKQSEGMFGCSSVSITYQTKIRSELIKSLPDLTKSDIDIATEFYYALNTKKDTAKARNELLKRIAVLYDMTRSYPPGSLERIDALKRLINFQKILRSKFTADEVKASLWKKPYSDNSLTARTEPIKEFINISLVEIAPQSLPGNIQKILKTVNIETGLTGWDYVRANARSIIFIPHMDRTIRSVSAQDQGTAEELTWTIFIDPLGEIFGLPSPAWSIAATLMHEAAHLDYYNKNGNDLKKMSFNNNEKYATIKTCEFYVKLIDFGIGLSKSDKESIESNMKICKANIEYYNGLLGLPPDDMSK